MSQELPAGTPWWAALLVVAGVLVLDWWSTRRVKKATRATKDALDKVLDHVANNHAVGLRDDLDAKFKEVGQAMETLADRQDAIRQDVGGLHSEMRDARDDIGHVQRDVDGIRTEGRRDRRRLSRLERLASTALDRAQAVIDEQHPGTQLRDPDPTDT